MKKIEKVTLIGLGAMGVFFAPRISENLGANFRILASGARKERLEKNGVTIADSTLDMIPYNYVTMPADKEATFQKMIEYLEDNDDVQEVYHNVEFSE